MRPHVSSVSVNELEIRLKGTRKGFILRELFTNSIHFPLANIFLELLLEGPLNYIKEFDPYALLAASLIQAYFLGSWQYEEKHPRLFWGNLIGPTIYTTVELILRGWQFFSSPYHIAYWIFSLLIGLLREIGIKLSGPLWDVCILLEHFVRTNILLVTYWIFEIVSKPENLSPWIFLDDMSHVFITIVIPLLGIIVGFANITATHYMKTLRQTATQLQKYSEWFFGRDLLSRAVTDSTALTLTRRERIVIFMDIRGFTNWSETRTPEEVVAMLNAYFETAEQLWKDCEQIIKVKHTGDEIMAVFSTVLDALRMTIRLRKAIQNFLEPYHLSAGIGIHSGPLVEGLIGSKEVKAYDIIGDTVNTAKRICDKAGGGEILISQECYTKIKNDLVVLESRFLKAKGKSKALQVYPVKGFKE